MLQVNMTFSLRIQMFYLLDRLAAMWNIYRVTRANVKIMNY